MNKPLGVFHEKPYLAWYVRDVKNISKESLLEHIFNYGNWEDYIRVEEALGIKETREIFNDLRDKARPNLRRKTINYFEKYFRNYA